MYIDSPKLKAWTLEMKTKLNSLIASWMLYSSI